MGYYDIMIVSYGMWVVDCNINYVFRYFEFGVLLMLKFEFG